MNWRIGDWQIFKEGEIHAAIKRCIRLLQDQGFRIESGLITSEGQEIDYRAPEGGFFEKLNECEKERGIEILLESLIQGRVILRAKKADVEIDFRLFLHAPEDTQENLKTFKEIITEWVKQDKLSFTERFFRLPKISEDIADRYLDNPLEQVLKRTFGFHFKYKLIITSPDISCDGQKLRESFYKIVAYS